MWASLEAILSGSELGLLIKRLWALFLEGIYYISKQEGGVILREKKNKFTLKI